MFRNSKFAIQAKVKVNRFRASPHKRRLVFKALPIIFLAVVPLLLACAEQWFKSKDYESWARISWWSIQILAALFACFLAVSSFVDQFSSNSEFFRRRRRTVNGFAQEAINRFGVVPSKRDNHQIRKNWLRCIEVCVSDLIPRRPNKEITVSLVVFDGSVEHMRVDCRNNHHPTSTPGKNYPTMDMVAGAAFEHGLFGVVHDTTVDDRYANLSERGYRSIIAIPVMKPSGDTHSSNKAYGAISIDSPDAHDFNGIELDVYDAVHPFACAIGLTFHRKSLEVTCENGHIRQKPVD